MRQRCTRIGVRARSVSPRPASVSPYGGVIRRIVADDVRCARHRCRISITNGAAMLRWLGLVSLAALAHARVASSQSVGPDTADVSLMFRGARANTGVAMSR